MHALGIAHLKKMCFQRTRNMSILGALIAYMSSLNEKFPIALFIHEEKNLFNDMLLNLAHFFLYDCHNLP